MKSASSLGKTRLFYYMACWLTMLMGSACTDPQNQNLVHVEVDANGVVHVAPTTASLNQPLVFSTYKKGVMVEMDSAGGFKSFWRVLAPSEAVGFEKGEGAGIARVLHVRKGKQLNGWLYDLDSNGRLIYQAKTKGHEQVKAWSMDFEKMIIKPATIDEEPSLY